MAITTNKKIVPAPAPAAAAATTPSTPAKPAAAPAPAKSAAPATPATPATPADVTAPAVPEVDEVTQGINKLLECFTTINNSVKDAQNVMKLLQKNLAKIAKTASKKSGRKAASSAKRTPSGFAKPTALSAELTSFLGLEAGTQKARTDVTRLLNEYIKKHSLQDATDKRKIKPDAALAKLMNLTDKDVLTYFNLQSHIKHHFLKA